MAYGAILGQTPDLGAYANSVQLTTTGSSTYTLTLPDGTDIVSGVSEALGLPNTFTRMQIVSYVGTGTYGESNPCSITADFPIKVLLFIGAIDKSSMMSDSFPNEPTNFMISDALSTSFSLGKGICLSYNSSSYGKKSFDGCTFYWYHDISDDSQANNSYSRYYFLCIGE